MPIPLAHPCFVLINRMDDTCSEEKVARAYSSLSLSPFKNSTCCCTLDANSAEQCLDEMKNQLMRKREREREKAIKYSLFSPLRYFSPPLLLMR